MAAVVGFHCDVIRCELGRRGVGPIAWSGGVQRVESCMVVHNAVGLTSIKGGFSALLLLIGLRLEILDRPQGNYIATCGVFDLPNPNLDSRIHFRRGFTN